MRKLISYFNFSQRPDALNSLNTRLQQVSRIKLCIYGALLILSWQLLFFAELGGQNSFSGSRSSAGFMHQNAQHFFYYFHYLGLFPVANELSPEDDSVKGAEQHLRNNGSTLIMEVNSWSRLGNIGRIYLYKVKAWLTGSAKNPSLKPFNGLFFMLSLLALWWTFVLLGESLLGLSLVVAFGSSPYFLNEIYYRENIFALGGTSFLFLLAMNLIFLKKERFSPLLRLATPIVSGGLVALVSNVRTENVALMGCLVFLYLFQKSSRHALKVICIALAIVGFTLTSQSLKTHFDKQFTQASRIVEELGGHVYRGHTTPQHTFWHPMFCGLGDYGADKGYAWNDKVAHRFALPKFNKIFGTNYTMPKSNLRERDYGLDQFYDKAQKYYVVFELLPGYDGILKSKVLHDILESPGWYLSILLKRTLRFFVKTSPVALTVSFLMIPLPFWGIFCIPLFFYCFRRKQRLGALLMLSSIPLGSSAILVYSKGHTTYLSIFHLIGFGIVISMGLEYLYRCKYRSP